MTTGIAVAALPRAPQVQADLLEPYLVEVIIPFDTGTVDEAVRLAGLAAQQIVQAAIGPLVAGAPATLDTFLEAYNRFVADENAAAALTALVGTKAPTDSPAFTGTPTAPTPSAGDSDTSIATTAFVAAAVQALQQTLKAIATTGLLTDADTTAVPTTDPGVAGKIWNNGGLLAISNGA